MNEMESFSPKLHGIKDRIVEDRVWTLCGKLGKRFHHVFADERGDCFCVTEDAKRITCDMCVNRR